MLFLLLACTPTKDTDPADSTPIEDTAADDSGADSGSDSGGDTGADSGDDSGGDTGVDSGADSADTGDSTDTGDSAETGDTGVPTDTRWLDVVYPLLQRDCLDCHERWGASEGMVYTTLITTEERGEYLLVPGDPGASLLYVQMTAAARERMPLAVPYVPDDDMAAFRDWIAAGASDADGFGATFGTIWRDYECRACHAEWEEGDGRLTPTEITSRTSGSGDPFIVPGSPDTSFLYLKMTDAPPDYGQRMPEQFTYVDDALLAEISDWITDGAVVE